MFVSVIIAIIPMESSICSIRLGTAIAQEAQSSFT